MIDRLFLGGGNFCLFVVVEGPSLSSASVPMYKIVHGLKIINNQSPQFFVENLTILQLQKKNSDDMAEKL